MARRLAPALWLSVLVPLVAFAAEQQPAPQAEPQSASQPKPQDVQGIEAAVAIEQALVQVIAAREHSVVSIGMFRTDPDPLLRDGFHPTQSPPSLDDIPDAFATGVVVDQRGLILTCAHALKERTTTFVRFAGNPVWWHTRVRASDPYSDLAVLEIVNSKAVIEQVKPQPMTLGDAGSLRKGQLVITLGNPYAIARDGEVSAGWGIVSNLRRKAAPLEGNMPLKNTRPTLHHLGTLIQTDAKLNLGTSGGALLNLKGEMVGLTTSMAALSGYEKSAGYAIAVDKTFLRVLKELKEGREVEYGFLGVGLDDLPSYQRTAGETGVQIARVIAGGPSEGRLDRDDVITHINGQPILTVTDVMLAVSQLAPDNPIRFRVLRTSDFEPRPRVETVHLTKKYIEGKRIVTRPRTAWRGIRVEYTAAFQPLYADARIEPGVTVTEILSDTAAASTGLEVGRRITHVDGVAVNSPVHFLRAVENRKGPVRLSIEPEADSVVVPQPTADGG